MEQREQCVHDAHLELYAMTELCARYGITPKTGYKWLARFEEQGRAGLADRSHAPHHCPHRIPPAVARVIVAARRAQPSWGPRKLLDWLVPRHPEVAWPAISTAGDLLARRGLVKKRRRRRQHTHPGVVPAVTHEPNDLWTADFKGHFKTRDGVYCYPLTVADQHTRYLLGCQGLLSIHGWRVRPVFERLFKEYGLPRAIRTDNGVPFATQGLHGLSQLNVWWMRLGITHQRIRPARPQENGCHERMHKTLKYEATRPPKQTLAAQQRRFATFRAEYNRERPHEALGGKPPASRYRSSPRPYPATLPALEYPGHFLVKPVTAAGNLRSSTSSSSLRTRWRITASGSTRSLTACGRSISAPCSWVGWTSGRTRFMANPHGKSVTNHPGLFCYPSSRLLSRDAWCRRRIGLYVEVRWEIGRLP